MIQINRTFTTEDCPKSGQRLYVGAAFFRDSFFEFSTFFLLLYVQLASPISSDPDYSRMFLTITMASIAIKVLAGFCWTFAAVLLERHRFKNGNYRTLSFIGAVLETVFFLLLFFVSPLFSGWGYVAAFLVFDTLVECVYSLNDTPYWAYIVKISTNEKVRSRVSSLTNVCCSVGIYLVAGIAPAVTGENTRRNMTILALVLVSFFFVTQMIYVLFLQEREEPWVERKTPLFEPFRILFRDKEIFLVILSSFLLNLAQDCYIGNSSTYFSYEFGYGTFRSPIEGGVLSGGTFSFLFSLIYGVGYILAMLLYPLFQSRAGKRKITFAGFFLEALVLLFLFFFGFVRGKEVLGLILGFLLGFSVGLPYLANMMNCSNASEYYEWKYGEDRSASVTSLRAFAYKAANGIQTGLLYLMLASSGLLTTNRTVASLEAKNPANLADLANEAIQSTENIEGKLTIYRSFLTFLPMAFLLGAMLIMTFSLSFADEKSYLGMVEEIKKRKNVSSEEARPRK